MESLESNGRGCVVPSDIVNWIENNSSQLAAMLTGKSLESKNVYDHSELANWDKRQEHRSKTNKLIRTKASEDSIWFRQSIHNLIQKLNPENKELTKFMFYDKNNNIITEKIIHALSDSRTLSDIDREYIKENCIEIFNNTKISHIFWIGLYHDTNTKHLLAKLWWYPTMVFDKIESIGKDAVIMTIDDETGIFTKESEILICNEHGKGTLVSKQISYPLSLEWINPREIRKMSYMSKDKERIQVSLSTDEEMILHIVIKDNIASLEPEDQYYGSLVK